MKESRSANSEETRSLAEMSELVERYRAAYRRAALLAAAVTLVAAGVWLGWMLSRSVEKARADEGEATSQLSSAFVEIARTVEPSVVNITTVTQPAAKPRGSGEPGGGRPSIDGLPFVNSEPVRRGNGSGVIVDAQGYILTNNHVVQGADRIKVILYDGSELRARLIGADRETDLAVIKVDPQAPLKAARIGDSEKIRVGDWVLAIGSPFGFDQTVTAGIISAKERDSNDLYKRVGFQFFLQTDAAINRGNSGGPLINLAGEVIGINTAIATSTGDYNGICFALPSDEAISVYRQLVREGRVVRGFLGALTERVTPQIARVFGLPFTAGAIVSNVNETMEVDGKAVESPAAKAGLRPHDVIFEFRGERIKDDGDLVRKVASTPVGTQAPLRIFRQGEEMTLQVIIGRRPGGIPEKSISPTGLADSLEGPRPQSLGIRIESITPQVAREKQILSTRGCLVLRVEPGSVADDAELRANDIIESINRQPVKDNDDFKRVLNQLRSGDPVVLQVYRESLQPVPRIFISLNKP